MKLSNEDRATMVRLEMEKAHVFLNQAELMFTQKQWDLAANRFYYSCFHAVQALFIYNGLASRRHSGMISQFGMHFVKTHVIDDRLGGFLTRMEQLRERADYNCIYSVTQTEVEVMIEPARELISKIEDLLQKEPTVKTLATSLPKKV